MGAGEREAALIARSDQVAYRRLVLSPHLDDAPLSCGGAIHRWTAAGESTLVVTFMTADPPAGELSAFARYQHTSWGLPAQEAFAVRRVEEQAAMEVLGADHCHLGLHDSIYRGNANGAYYHSDPDIFGAVHPADAAMADVIAEQLAALEEVTAETAVYAPLGLGNHVDHQLVRTAAEAWRGRELLYYEDFPYAVRPRDWTVDGTPTLVALSEADMRAKVDAIACYRSQIAMLFGKWVELEAAIWDFGRGYGPAAGAGWAERLWRPNKLGG